MASCRRRKSGSDARRDVISQLPADVKERILECLPTRDAARTALLSTHWNDVWLRHGRLVVDSHFFQCVSKCKGDKAIALVNIINNILLLRAGPVKKFTLHIGHYSDPRPQQSDLDRWCRSLSRNGLQELNFNVLRLYSLPSCIVSCRTIKQLLLGGFFFDLPINARCIFPAVTSLVFKHVEFSHYLNGIVYNIPNLEKLAFDDCNGTCNFVISAPKLERLSAIGDIEEVDSRWFTLHLKAIKTLCLSPGILLSCENILVAAPTFPTAINLQVMQLYDLSFACGKHFTFAMLLLEKSPNLCKLEIVGTELNWYDDKEAASRILEDPDSYVINQNLNMLNTVKIESFIGSRLEMLLVKALLSKSPALEKVIIQESANMDPAMAFKIPRELLCFPRASPKAQLVFVECKSNYSLVGSPKF